MSRRRITSNIKRWLIGGALGVLTVSLWLAASIPSGFAVRELLMFVAPGAVLAIAASWMSHAFTRGTWVRADGAKAAVCGALLLPPALAFGIALLSALSGGAIVAVFVLGAWLALGVGLAVGAMRGLRRGEGLRRRTTHQWMHARRFVVRRSSQSSCRATLRANPNIFDLEES